MKAVLLAGGLGTRMREETEFRPKPMVEIGGKPVLWHIMKILGAQGISEFIICSGYKSEYIKSYFYNYGASNLDFTVKLGDRTSAVFHGEHDEFDWTVTVVDTGLETLTGGRLRQVEKYLDEDPFLVTYGDGIADINLKDLTETHSKHGKIATVTATHPGSRFGVLELDNQGMVTQFREKPVVSDLVNIGFFVFSSGVFEYLDDSSALEEGPLRKLAQVGQLGAYQHNGFWQPMDTFREYQSLNALWANNSAPWKIW